MADDAWHPGVVGIVASKLVEQHSKPAVVIGEGGRGSARTFGALHLYDAIAKCSDHLIKFGGHRAAAGLRIARDRIDGFRAELCSVVEEMQADLQTEPLITYDMELDPLELGIHIVRAVSALEPFGVGNPEPTLRLRNLAVREKRIVGGQHLKLRLACGPRPSLSAIGFRLAEDHAELAEGESVELLGHVELDAFDGLEKVQVRVRHLRRCGPEALEIPEDVRLKPPEVSKLDAVVR
ncbi:MAG: hypothetical protein HC923_08180 [Myxococcales bacterium]|nr:hypothetical protein [Myxococcales bacterium]